MRDIVSRIEELRGQTVKEWVSNYISSKPAFRKRSAEEISLIADEVISDVDEMWSELTESSGIKTAEEHLSDEGYSVTEDYEHYIGFAPRFAELDDSNRTVIVFIKTVDKIERFLKYHEDLGTDLPNVKEVLLAHELCHVLQDKKEALWRKKYKRREWICISELQARVFSAKLCGFTFSPAVYEEMLLYDMD